MDGHEQDGILNISRSRSKFYELLSALTLFPPRREVLGIVRDGSVLSSFPDVFSPETRSLLQQLRELDEDDLKAITKDFRDLFDVPGPRYTTPYEAVYMDKREVGQRVVGGLLMGESTVSVQRLYERARLKLSDEVKELPDHIGIEFAFMSFLCSQEAEARETRDDKRVGRLLREQMSFLREHLSGWIVALCRSIAENAETDFYRCVGRMMEEFVEADLEGIDSLAASVTR